MPAKLKIGDNISWDARVIANALNSFFAGTARRLLTSEAVSVAFNNVKRTGDFTQAD